MAGKTDCCSYANSNILNDRILRSVSDVIQRELNTYLAEKLDDYALYKDTYNKIMDIPVTRGCCCESLKKEVDELKTQLSVYCNNNFVIVSYSTRIKSIFLLI